MNPIEYDISVCEKELIKLAKAQTMLDLKRSETQKRLRSLYSKSIYSRSLDVCLSDFSLV